MSTPDRFYVTTPIYYVNDVPHLGHAYTTVLEDAFARFHMLRGEKTRALTGTDEHGLKIGRAAQERGVEPHAFVDEVSAAFRGAWPKLLCRPDDFIRTTEPRHIKGAQEIWKRCAAAGDIFLGSYDGLYCTNCEQYYTEKELIDEKLCPVHKKPVERLIEQSYMFRLSEYADKLVDLYTREPWRVQPESRRNEVLSFLRGGLTDLSVSRTTFSWGIPVPGDERHVMYVWFDALANYYTALETPELRNTFWPPDLQLVGKDILRFHTVYWPAFLLSAGFTEAELPRTVFAHGFLTVNGEKMSKSIRETVVPPHKLIESFGADEVRYYLLREISFGQDGDFSLKSLINRVRSELSGTVGNLLNRTLPFLAKHFEGVIPAGDKGVTDTDRALQEKALTTARESAAAWKGFEPHRAMELAIQLAMAGNKYFDENAPWALAKNPEQRERLGTVLFHVLESLRVVATLLWPALPDKMDALRAQLGLGPLATSEGIDQWPAAWGTLAAGTKVAAGAPLFRNWTKDDEAAVLGSFAVGEKKADEGGDKKAKGEKPKSEKKEAKTVQSDDKKLEVTPEHTTEPQKSDGAAAPAGAAAAVEKKPEAEAGAVAQIEFTDFEKVELKLALVQTAERIPKKDMLLRLTVDAGEPEPRTIIAGIAKAYAPEQLVGKRIVIVANLKPRDFGKGLVSHGMLLACGPKESLSVVTVEREQAPGTRVK